MVCPVLLDSRARAVGRRDIILLKENRELRVVQDRLNDARGSYQPIRPGSVSLMHYSFLYFCFWAGDGRNLHLPPHLLPFWEAPKPRSPMPIVIQTATVMHHLTMAALESSYLESPSASRR